MPELRILWTALPRAADDDHLDVDVFISPRLGVEAPSASAFTLADFPLFANWPAQVDDHLTYEVELAPGQPLQATRVPLDAADSPIDLDEATWQRLFPAATPVRPWSRRSPAGRPLFSFPADAVADYLRDTYRKAGQDSIVDPILGDDLDAIVEDVGDLLDTRIDVERGEPTSETTGGETTGGGPAPTTTEPGCARGCLTAPGAWLAWLLRWLWHQLTGRPPPPPKLLVTTGSVPPPVSVTPKVVTYRFPPRGPAPTPPAVAAVEQHVAATGVTPPAGWAPPGSALSASRIALASAWRFHRRPEDQHPPAPKPDVTLVPPGPELKQWDFHQRLGALGDYPLLLRRLGLVVRLRMPRPATAPTSVRVVPLWDGQPLPARDLTPRTRCLLEDALFVAEPRPGSELTGGVVDLTDAGERMPSASGYRLMVVDTDGAALKLVHTAASLVRHRALRARGLVRNAVREEGLAALRSAGIAIVRTGRAGALKAQLDRFETIAPPTQEDAPDELFADDLVRGFRVEVQDVTDGADGPWRSLCRREGTYYVLDDAGQVLDTFSLSDQGYVKRSAATSADAEASALYLHESLVRWTGWSLVAPRPGRRIKSFPGTRVEDGRTVPTQEERAVAPIPEPQSDLHLTTTFQPEPGTLPKLRFGRRYRLRLPWVDLSGEAAATDDTAPASGGIDYRRFEPLAPPALLPLDEFTAGESLECLVIRSDIDRDAARYVVQVLQPVAPGEPYRATAARHVFPAKVGQEQAEQHRSFDGRTMQWAWEASLRADNALDVNALRDLDDPTVVVPFGQPDTVEIEGTPDPNEPPGTRERYAVNRHDGTLPTPYLPDPLAAGVALRRLPRADLADTAGLTLHAVPGGSELVCHVDFGDDWPELPSFRIRVAERPSTLDPDTGIESFVNPNDRPQWDANARVLTVFLAKGEVAEVLFSTRPEGSKIDWLGATDWLDVLSGSPLQQSIRLGCHWLVSPARALTLVHAVQRPLAPAELTSAGADKEPGATVATISGRMRVHPGTTGHVTLLAAWDDEIDDGTSNDLVQVSGAAVLDTFSVPPELVEGAPGDAAFPPVLPADEPAQASARHELGDPKHRLVRYRLRASTRFREFFPQVLAGATQPDGSDGFSRVGSELVVSVPNSVPPAAVSLQYVVPSFGWDASHPAPPTSWTSFSRARKGGGIRVFLDRPWFTSGPGEQLGVVVPRAGEQLAETVGSQLGVDPTWSSAWTPTMPELAGSMFVGGDVHDSVRLEDGTLVDVVGYDPELDVERNLWYADVALDTSVLPATYWPFVRLALVRFQPSSIEGAGASKVVLSEFTQLAPDRELEIEVVGTDVKVVVRGRGPEVPTKNVMLIALDEADVPDPDELAWRPAGTSAATGFDTPLEARLGEAVEGVPDGDGFRWERTVSMPGPRGDRTLRVVVRELELRQADAEVVEQRFAGIELDNDVVVHLVRNRLLPRIVYADDVRLA
jgi:hypothetical protein